MNVLSTLKAVATAMTLLVPLVAVGCNSPDLATYNNDRPTNNAYTDLENYAKSIKGKPKDKTSMSLGKSQGAVLTKVSAPAAKDLTFVGSNTCTECHKSQHVTYSKTLHGKIFLGTPRSTREKLGCESCHGAASNHVKIRKGDQGLKRGLIAFRDDSPRPVEERNGVCLSCHENGMRTHWRGSEHETRNLACTNCHTVMRKKSPKFQLAKATVLETCFQCHKNRKSQLWSASHMPIREGKVTCTNCHNPHGTASEKLLKTTTVNETCYQCHADKRGPFLWEHAPVRESCLNCHDPHGKQHRSLLKVAAPRLCQQCHSQTLANHPSNPGNLSSGIPRQIAINRGCANCHSAIHGSNHVRGADLHR